MDTSFRYYFLIFSLLLSLNLMAQTKKVLAPTPSYPIPTAKQLAWHQMEMNAFIHFTTNTFTDKEWGFGDEANSVFNPEGVNANQWAKTLKDAGFKMIILTTKHHDGFCLWPSKFTDHSVKNSPYKQGKGDIVKETSDAAKKFGLKFGVYLSPWDRNRADYGQPTYITYYRNQLKELFTQYGKITEMWFDGANGGDGFYGGANETRKIDGKTYYDWKGTLKLIRGIQPNVVFFSDAGPDIRWVGNEKGVAGNPNWNNISTDTLYAGKSGIEKLLNSGSEKGKNWIPAEVDVSIRPGWFYHEKEDNLVKTPEQLFEIYLSSVGRGSNLLLNIPPDRTGNFHANDVNSLQGFNMILKKELGNNLAFKANTKASSFRGNAINFASKNLTDGDKNSYWTTNDDIKTAQIEINLGSKRMIKYVILQEYIQLGQRVKAFSIDVWKEGIWQSVANETTIGYKRIIKISPEQTDKIRINILESKACPVLSNIEVY
jgi:alpha-L-fucosidase